jgi:hypothetical protein
MNAYPSSWINTVGGLKSGDYEYSPVDWEVTPQVSPITLADAQQMKTTRKCVAIPAWTLEGTKNCASAARAYPEVGLKEAECNSTMSIISQTKGRQTIFKCGMTDLNGDLFPEYSVCGQPGAENVPKCVTACKKRPGQNPGHTNYCTAILQKIK